MLVSCPVALARSLPVPELIARAMPSTHWLPRRDTLLDTLLYSELDVLLDTMSEWC
jgi:hypothetical protein